jgi:hypothetical protein
MLEDKLPSLSRPAGFQPDEEEAEQDARPPSHASSVTSDRYYLKGDELPHPNCEGRLRMSLLQTLVATSICCARCHREP